MLTVLGGHSRTLAHATRITPGRLDVPELVPARRADGNVFSQLRLARWAPPPERGIYHPPRERPPSLPGHTGSVENARPAFSLRGHSRTLAQAGRLVARVAGGVVDDIGPSPRIGFG
jgi:hypothetical protein